MAYKLWHAAEGRPHAFLIGGDAQMLGHAQACFPAFAWRQADDSPRPAKRAGLFGRGAPAEPWTARLGPQDVVVVWGASEAPAQTAARLFALEPVPIGGDDPDLSLSALVLRLRPLRGARADELGAPGLPSFLLRAGGAARAGIVVVGGSETLDRARAAHPGGSIACVLRPAPTADQLFEAQDSCVALAEISVLPALLARAEQVFTDIIEIALAARAAGASVTVSDGVGARLVALDSADGWYGLADPQSLAPVQADAAMQRWRRACGMPPRIFLADETVAPELAALCFPALDWRGPAADAPTEVDWIAAGDAAAVAAPAPIVGRRFLFEPSPFEAGLDLPGGVVCLSLKPLDGAPTPELDAQKGLPAFVDPAVTREGVFAYGDIKTVRAARARFPDAPLRVILRTPVPFPAVVALQSLGAAVAPANALADELARAESVVTDAPVVFLAALSAGASAYAEEAASDWVGRAGDAYFGFADLDTHRPLTFVEAAQLWRAALATVDAQIDPPPRLDALRHVMIGQPGRAIRPFARHLGPDAWQKPVEVTAADLASAASALARCAVTIYARDTDLLTWMGAPGRAHWIVDREPIDYPLMLTTSGVHIPCFNRHRVRLEGEQIVYAPQDAIAEWSAQTRAEKRAFGECIAPRLRRLQSARRLARYNKVEMGRRFGPLGAERVLVLGEETEGPKHLSSNPDGVKDIDVLRLALQERPFARILYAPQRKTLANEAKLKEARALSDRVQIVDQAFGVGEYAHVVDELRTIDNLQGALALAFGLKVVVHGRPPYAGLGVTRDVDGAGADLPPCMAEPLDVETFLGWYFGECLLFADPLDGAPMGVEAYLDSWTPYLGELSGAQADRIVELACDPGQSAADRRQFIRALAAHAMNDQLAALVARIGHPEAVKAHLDLASDLALDVARRGDWRDAVRRVRALWSPHGATARAKLFALLVAIRRTVASSADARAFAGYVLSLFRHLSSTMVQELGDAFAADRYYGAALTFYASCQNAKEVVAGRVRCLIAIGDIPAAETTMALLRAQKAASEDLEFALLERKGEIEAALKRLAERARKAPADADQQLRLANAYRDAGRLQEAQDIAMVLLRSKHSAAAGRLLAGIYLARMETDPAKGFIEALLQERPTDVAALRVLADIRSFENDLTGACEALLDLLKLSPLNIGAHTQLTELEAEMGVAEADGLGPWTRAFDAFLDDIDQPSAETLMGRGRALLQQHDFDTLKRNCRTIEALFPADVSAHAWLAHALAWEPGEKAPETLATIRAEYDLALARERDDNAWMMLDSIRSAAHLGDIATIRRMIRENHFALNIGDREKLVIPRYSAAMALGDYAGVYDGMRSFARTRVMRRHARPFCLALSMSEIPPEKAILLTSEGGVGDELRYSLIYPELVERLGKVTITVDRRLATLFERSYPMVDRFIPLSRYDRKRLNRDLLDELCDLPDRELAPFFNNAAWRAACESDVVAPIPCLLADLRKTDADFARAHGVRLMPRSDLVAAWRERLAPYANQLIVGATWTSMMRQYQRVGAYLSHEEMGPLFQVPGAVFVNCQYDPMDEELRWARDSLGVEIVDFPDLDKRDDFEGLAALIANLDLFVGTGTTTTEFAALVGCPTIYASPVSMNAYRNPDLSETDRYFAHVRHVRPIPASNRGPMMARIQELVGEAVAAKAAGQPTRPAAPTQLETTVLVAAQPAQTVQARSGGYRRGRRQRKIHA